MRKQYTDTLKHFFHKKVKRSRKDLGITQEEMADRLLMAGRTYIDLEQGKNCCSALTLALYMIYVSSDPVRFLEELREAFELDSTQVA